MSKKLTYEEKLQQNAEFFASWLKTNQLSTRSKVRGLPKSAQMPAAGDFPDISYSKKISSASYVSRNEDKIPKKPLEIVELNRENIEFFQLVGDILVREIVAKIPILINTNPREARRWRIV
jgi:hypothetical protein